MYGFLDLLGIAWQSIGNVELEMRGELSLSPRGFAIGRNLVHQRSTLTIDPAPNANPHRGRRRAIRR